MNADMCQSVERRKRLFYQIIFLSLTETVAITKDVFEYTRPLDCKPKEYFDVISLSCIKCDPRKNLEPSADRLRCICNKLSKTIGFKNGYPLCTLCGPNAVVTTDGGECVACKKGICKCSSNEIQIDRNINGTLLSNAYCLSCPTGSYPSYDGLRCLPCNNIGYSLHVNCPCPPVSHIRVQNYCLRKDDLSDWLDVRSTYLIKFNKQNIDSYYFRAELQAAMYFCKKKDRLACEHLSNMCVLTLYDNGVPCMLFMQPHISPTWLFYNEEERAAVIHVQNKEKQGKIYVPLLIVEYEEITNTDPFDIREIFIDYKITFILKNHDINYDLQVLIGVFSGIAVIFSAIKTWSHCKRNHNCTLNFALLIWFIIYAMGTVGSTITLTLVLSGIYIFIFYKGQTAPYILLPDTKNEGDMQIYMAIAFSFKVVEVIGFIYRQWNMDIFFIDWEQPRKLANEFKYDSPLQVNILNLQKLTNMKLTLLIWRTYFVANEWLNLQTRRRTNILLQTIFTLSILEVIGLHFWTAAIPELTLDSDFSKDNLCSITNISVFILPFNYYGFYIHGRSVHGYADTDLRTLISDLKNEESNLCAHRGLVPGTTDQTYIVSLTETFKMFYDNLHKHTNHGAKKFLRMRNSPETEWDQILDIRLKVKHFLSEFIDHCFKDEDYIIKEQHFLEKLFDITYINPKEKSIFYIDNSYCFDKVTFYGNEWLLATFEITVFVFAIVVYKECTFACIIVIIMSKSVLLIAKCFNKWNFGNKSLLDKRFLM
ncbi:hypothetical protein KM043_014777 [Ampulex compressa]|nr:hypothetical protein KM043_014777 [Ampulex compressa]